MKQNDRVIFRKWNKTNGGNVIAFLPDNEANYGLVDSYEHIGQHREADYIGLLSITTLAKSEEYNDLLEELKSIGYNPKIIKKLIKYDI